MAFLPRLEQISQIIPPGLEVHLVGGAVRDNLLNLAIHDMDFVLDRDSIAIARRLADTFQAAFYLLDSERDTGRVILTEPGNKRLILDFSLRRGPDLESDLRARDFTINAMALDIRRPQKLIDPLCGARDLHSKLLRACSTQAFMDDPLRILRGVRLAATFGLRIQPDTLQFMRQAIPELPRVSQERVRDELFRILGSSQPVSGLRTLEWLGVLPSILPELHQLKGFPQPPPHIADIWEHTLSVIQDLEVIINVLSLDYDPDIASNLWGGLVSLRLGRYREQIHAHLNALTNPDRSVRDLLLFAALYHDAAKPKSLVTDETGKIHFYGHDEMGSQLVVQRARELRLTNEEISRLGTVVRGHMRPIFLAREQSLPSHRAIYHFFRDTGVAGVDICLLSLADTMATYGPGLPQALWEHHLDTIRTLLEAWWERREENINPSPLINGNELMAQLEIKPGPEVGRILEAIREAQAVGQITNIDQALNLARSIQHEGR
jgi:poly(A) polymerase